MASIQYKATSGEIKTLVLTDEKHKVWRKFKRTLAIKEPCKVAKIHAFKSYCRRQQKKSNTHD